MGPSQKQAYADAEVAFDEIWALLMDKYHLYDPDKWHTHYMDSKGKRRKLKEPIRAGHFVEEYSDVKRNFKDSLKEVFWLNACNSF
jgi:hypothetical protein